ncbi:MAG: AAA family ATPase [Duganella sp.]
MYIKHLRLDNFGPFPAVDLDFAPTTAAASNVTVLIGSNGAGKTSVLKALAISLSWFVARLRSEKSNGAAIDDSLVYNSAASAAISVIAGLEANFAWSIAKTRAGRKGDHASQLLELKDLTEVFKQQLGNNENSSLPLIAFYPVERTVLDIPLKIKQRHTFSQLDGYDNALHQGVDFRRFFEWFREREDFENEVLRPTALLEAIDKDAGNVLRIIESINGSGKRMELLEDGDLNALQDELKRVSEAFQLMQSVQATNDTQLHAVRTAISNFMPGFSKLQVKRKPRLHMSINKNGQTLNVAQLSQGEKSLMALVGDIARRLAILNPGMDNPLLGKGIVLIDEVDMHLHPQWARPLIERLTTTFPHCQFILSTHSPLVISDCKDVLVYALENGHLSVVPSQYGQDANTVLLEVMDTHVRNASVASRLGKLLDLIQDHQLDAARAALAELNAELPPHNIELLKAGLLLRKEELRSAKN